MPLTTRAYRVRIHDGTTAAATFTNPATAGGNALVVTSLRGGTNPYLAAAPRGDGQTLDPITGKVEIGAYKVQVIDAAPAGPTSRVVTSVLADANARWQLLSRLAAVETSANDGATWTTLLVGYLNAIKLADALTYDLAIGETRRAELAVELFRRLGPPTNASGVLTSPTCLLGGPIRAGAAYNTRADAFGGVDDVGPVRVAVTSLAGSGESTGQLALSIVGGWLPPYYDELDTSIQAHELIALNHYARPFFVGGLEAGAYTSGSDWRVYGSFPGLVAELKPVGGGTTRYLRPLAAAARRRGSFPVLAALPDPDGPVGPYDEFVTRQGPAFRVAWDTATMGAKPAAGTQFDLVVYAAEPTAQLPLHERGHPIDLVTAKWTALGVRYDAAAAAAARTAINTVYGGAVVCELTWDAPMKLAAYVQQLLAFFGVGLRVDGTGALQCVGIRHAVPTVATPITLADLRHVDAESFDLSEGSVITTAELRQREFLFTRAVFDKGAPIADFAQIPLDNLRAAWHTVEGAADGTAAPGTERAHRWELPGRVLVNGVAQRAEDLALVAGGWLVNWRRRGAPTFSLACLPSVTAQVGDEIDVDLPHLPVAVVGAVPVAQRGQAPVTVRVLQRTETPEGPDLRVVLAPPLAQLPLDKVLAAGAGKTTMLLPELSVMRSTSDGARVALVELENAEDLAAGRQLLVLEYAVQASAPAGSGTRLGPFDPADAAASPVRYALPATTPEAVVWVRGRSELRAGGTSAWTAWQWVTLDSDTGGGEIPDPEQVPTLAPRAEYTSATQGRAWLKVADPSGKVNGAVQARTSSGGGAWSALSNAATSGGEYYRDVTLAEGQPSAVEFVVPYLDVNGVQQQLREHVPFPLRVVPTVLSLTMRPFGRVRTIPGPNSTGSASAKAVVDAKTASVKFLARTDRYPTEAEVLASGVTVNVPAGSRDVYSDPLVTISFGGTAYGGVIPFSGAGATGEQGKLVTDDWSYAEGQPSTVERTRVDSQTVYKDVLANFTVRPQINGQSIIAQLDAPNFGLVQAPGVTLARGDTYVHPTAGTVHHYQLGWQDDSRFSASGPTCVLSGYGGISLQVHGVERVVIPPAGAMQVSGALSVSATLDVGQVVTAADYAYNDGGRIGRWLSGASAPAPSLGEDGDWYLQTLIE